MKSLQEALILTAETGDVDFKSHFEATNIAELLEVIKDIVAMANSGGGIILFGLDDSGIPLALEEVALKEVDPAVIGDQIFKYTGSHFGCFEILEAAKNGTKLSAITIGPADYPLVFSKSGNYQAEGGKQKEAFRAGMVYFRHGAKSEPGTQEDLRGYFDRKIESYRKQWIEGIARVVEAPPGSTVQMLPANVRHSSSPAATEIRLTSNPNAPEYHLISIDETHPFRRKELIAEVQKRIGNGFKIGPFHIDCARKEFQLDGDVRFRAKVAHASPQYSKECVQLLVEKYADNSGIFTQLADKYRKRKAGA